MWIVFWRVWISSNKSSHFQPGGPTLLATSTAAKKAGGKQSWGDDNGTVATGHHHVLVAKSIGKMLLKLHNIRQFSEVGGKIS